MKIDNSFLALLTPPGSWSQAPQPSKTLLPVRSEKKNKKTCHGFAKQLNIS